MFATAIIGLCNVEAERAVLEIDCAHDVERRALEELELEVVAVRKVAVHALRRSAMVDMAM